ncbi:MAG: serine hydrolase [Planctomycetes bacterium]|nr:serine hydrolase [Planctomycetota bacterium]
MRATSPRPVPLVTVALLALAVSLRAQAGTVASQQPYFPPRGEWATRTPQQVGMNAERLDEAIAFAVGHESRAPHDLREFIATTLANEPHGEIVGPVVDRDAPNGCVVRHGYLVAEWGPTRRADMTFSVTKTYLSTVVGLAVDRGMIRNVTDPVCDYVPTDHFASEHNARITWDHLLRQTSDWRGTLWGKPDWADRPPRSLTLEQLPEQPLREPGTFYKYNDVRVNLLALATLHVWRRPLPQVLREYVMDPIGASSTWRWHGYDNSWVVVDGLQVQSVSGGGHWGGGMVISSRDQARFGYLFLRNGVWDGRRIVSEQWIGMARSPGPANPNYGYMNWFLNTARRAPDGTEHRPLPQAPASAVMFMGAGSNIVYIDWDHDLVVVARWIDDQLNQFLAKVLAAIDEA